MQQSKEKLSATGKTSLLKTRAHPSLSILLAFCTHYLFEMLSASICSALRENSYKTKLDLRLVAK